MNIVVIIIILVLISISVGAGIFLSGGDKKEKQKQEEEEQEEREKIFKQQSVSDYFGVEAGEPRRDMICPEGSYVTEFYGGSGSIVDSVGVKCSDGTTFNKIGGTGGGDYKIESPEGFTKLKSRAAGNSISHLALFSNSTQKGDIIGRRQSGKDSNIECPSGQKIKGFKEPYSGTYFTRAKVVCGKYV
jgi:hypothetical protein